MPPLVAVVGETATGKSALALRLAQQYDGELICADSWTVRRGMDIGTAKPLAEEQALVPHHLLDVVAPDEDFSAAVFKRLALKTVQDITARGRLPILVGGTGLYVDGVLFDYNFLPGGAPGQRKELNALGLEELMARVDAAGLDTDGVDIRNKRRLIRLLETEGAEQTKAPLRENTLIIGLKPDPDELKARITARVDAMLASGLEQEVRQVSQKYGWNIEGLKGIGYREWQLYFEGRQSLEQTRERIISATVQLARRQRTWFKRNKSIHWFSTPVNRQEIDDLITTFLSKK